MIPLNPIQASRSHAQTHAAAGIDPLTPAAIGAASEFYAENLSQDAINASFAHTNSAISSHLSAQNPHKITPTLIGAAPANHTHPYLSFSDSDYPYFKDIEFHGSGNPLAWAVNFHSNTLWAIYIIQIQGGCHLGNRGGGGFVIKKGIIRNTESSFSVFNIEENYYGTFYAGIISFTSNSANLIITINYPFVIDGRFTLLISGGGVNTIGAPIKPL